MNTIWKQWLYHLLSAGIIGASSAVGVCFIDPSAFNVTSAMGWAHIGELALFGFVKPVIAILNNGLPADPAPVKTL
jgi:hypothetical protein